MSRTTDAIAQTRRRYAEQAVADGGDLARLQALAAAAPPPRSLMEQLSSDALALVVEPKRATPSRGTIHAELDVAAVARECEAAGASAMSIVTDAILSDGSRDDVRRARSGCSLPIIARDFVIDTRQVLELRAAGADALLVPMFAHGGSDDDGVDEDQLDTGSLTRILQVARSVGMEVVLSVCSDDELDAALEFEADALNVDNRADDGSVDVERTFELLAQVPVGWPVVSESVAAADEVARLHRAGVDALLLDEGHLDIGLTAALEVFSDLTLDR